jgi:hypothetical protein
MEKYIEIIKLLERVFGKGSVAKSLGTRTNVVRFPKGSQPIDPTTRHFDVAGTAQKNPELVNTIKNSIGDRIPDLTKMNDQELLTYKQNLQRLADHIDPPSADIIAAGSKQRVTGEGIEALKQTAGQTYPPGTVVGDIQSRINKLKQVGKEMENATGEKATLTDVLKDFGTSQSSMSRMQDEGLVRAAGRQILINDIKAGKIKNLNASEVLNMKEPLDPFRQIYGEGALEQLDSLIPEFRGLRTEMDAEKLARSKFKFEPDETRLPGSTSIEDAKKAEQEFAINKPKETEVTNITAKVNKNTDIDSLIDEYNKNKGILSQVDDEGGTLIGYQEFNQLKNRNKEIENILDSLNVKSATEVEPEGIVIPFRKKLTEPENKAEGGPIGLDYLLGMDNRQNYAGGGDVKKILDIIAKINKELKGKKSMEVMNPKTGEITTPNNPVKTFEKKSTYYDAREEFDKLKSKHKDASAAHDELPSIDLYDKISADRLAEVMAEMKGKDLFDLPQKQQSDYYKKAQNYIDDLRRIDRTSKAVEKFNSGAELGVVDKQYLDKLKQVDLSDITQPQYTEVGGKKVLDATHPDTIQSFSDFAKASDPEGYAKMSKKVDRINELSTMKRNQKRFEQYDLEDYKKLDSTRINELLNDIKNPSSFLEEERNIVTNAAGKGLKNNEDIQFKVDKEKLQSHLEDLLKEKQIEEAQTELSKLKESNREPHAKGGSVGIDFLLGL